MNELPLDKAVTIIDAVKKLDWFSVWLWLSIVFPVFYIAIKKTLMGTKNTGAVDEKQNGEGLTGASWKDKIIVALRAFFTLPEINPLIIFASAFLFIAGTFVLIAGQQEKERIRIRGWALKNYMAHQHFYAMSIKEVRKVIGVNNKDLYSVQEMYPREYVIVSSDSIRLSTVPGISKTTPGYNTARVLDSTVLMVDSLRIKNTLEYSEKLLAAYLSDTAYMGFGAKKPFYELFKVDNIFTNEAINHLIINSNYKYTFFDSSGVKLLVKRR